MGSLNRVSPDALYAKAERIKHRWLVRVRLFATKPNRAKEVPKSLHAVDYNYTLSTGCCGIRDAGVIDPRRARRFDSRERPTTRANSSMVESLTVVGGI